MSVRDDILTRLRDVGFETGVGPLTPFGEPLPLVTAWAVEHSTASLALIVEDPNGVADTAPWNELLFALSGLRHELRDGSPPALGTPIAIAVVGHEEHEHRLRSLVESLSDQYVLFSRVELNVLVADGRPLNIDRALAPLLPHCRDALRSGTVIGTEVLGSLAAELATSISTLSETLDAELRERGDEVARRYADELSKIVAPTEISSQPLQTLFRQVRLTNFRSFADQQARLSELTLIEGLNGTGKSSVIEALEILWTGSSQRKPADEKPSVYDQHLARDGAGHWTLIGEAAAGPQARVERDHTDEGPRGLARNVFSQDGSVDIAGEAPDTRYSELLRVTGLSVPELLTECERLNREARDELNRVLSKLSIPPVRTNSRGIEAVRSALATVATPTAPSFEAVRNADARLAEVAGSAGLDYRPLDAPDDISAARAALEAEALNVAAVLHSTDAYQARVDELHSLLRRASSAATERALALEQLASIVSAARRADATPEQPPEVVDETSTLFPLPRRVASILLNTTRSLRTTLDELEAAKADVSDETWRDRLTLFISKAGDALEVIPAHELEDILERAAASPREDKKAAGTAPPAIPPDVFEAAGFVRVSAVDLPSGLATAARDVARELHGYANAADVYAKAILDSPQTRLEGAEDDLHHALAQFEIARALKAPVARTQEELLTRLLRGPLEPLLSELIGALTRFEWYFHPLSMKVRRGRVDLAGLATQSDELDVRMLLNAGERAIVALAWFLALYLLQPSHQREVLILDDPFSTLDENNRAALLATLQTVTRLARPGLLAISSHDRVTADAIEREFSGFRGWPRSIAKLAFSRSPEGATLIESLQSATEQADYERELIRIGISGAAELTASDA